MSWPAARQHRDTAAGLSARHTATGKKTVLDMDCDRNNEKQTKENIKELRENKMHQGAVQPS
jgi:hypothetical protein